jgi:hypothetical protein
MMTQKQPYDQIAPWKLIVGIGFLLLALFLPLASFWVAFLPLDAPTKAIIIGLLLLGAPEVCALIAALIMGKPAFNALKAMVKDWSIQQANSKTSGSKRLSGS